MRSVSRTAAAASVLVLLTGCATSIPPAAEAETHWSYDTASGPAAWGGLDAGFSVCGTGTEQSPIDLPAIGAPGAPALEIHTVPGTGEVVDTGHSVQVTSPAASVVHYAGDDYELVQLHVHTPAEHTVDGVAAAAELHLVHQNAAGERLVLGVLAIEGEASAGWQPFVDAVATDAPTMPVDVAALLPTSLAHEDYAGSLTTPPCTEGVQWVVLSTHVSLSADQIATLDGAHPGNARPTQPLGDRIVLSGP